MLYFGDTLMLDVAGSINYLEINTINKKIILGGNKMKILKDLRYAKGHEWVKVDGDKAYIGITDYAQDELGDIVFVELPETEEEVDVEDTLGAIESVKAASDIYAPVSGRIIEVNDNLEDSPELINEDPYDAWIVVIEMADKEELNALMDASAYEKFCEEEA